MNHIQRLIATARMELRHNGLLSLQTVTRLLDAGIDPDTIEI